MHQPRFMPHRGAVAQSWARCRRPRPRTVWPPRTPRRGMRRPRCAQECQDTGGTTALKSKEIPLPVRIEIPPCTPIPRVVIYLLIYYYCCYLLFIIDLLRTLDAPKAFPQKWPSLINHLPFYNYGDVPNGPTIQCVRLPPCFFLKRKHAKKHKTVGFF